MGKIIKWMASDKALHFLWCFLVTILISKFTNIYIGIGASVVLSILKEYYDTLVGGKWDWKDLIFGTAGIVLAILIILI